MAERLLEVVTSNEQEISVQLKWLRTRMKAGRAAGAGRRMSAGAADRLRAVEHAARFILRPMANPPPLGFLALAGGTAAWSSGAQPVFVRVLNW